VRIIAAQYSGKYLDDEKQKLGMNKMVRSRRGHLTIVGGTEKAVRGGRNGSGGSSCHKAQTSCGCAVELPG